MKTILGEVVIGVDAGTQGMRALAVGIKGVVAQAQVTYQGNNGGEELARLAVGSHEQDPGKWTQALATVLSKVAKSLREQGIAPEAVLAIALDGTSGTVAPLGAANEPLRPALMYNDARAEQEAEEAQAACQELVGRLGYRFSASFALPKILWVARHERALFDRVRLFAHQVDVLVGYLTGQYGVTDYTNALKTGYDVLAERYDPAITDRLGVSTALLPTPVAPGTPIAPLLPVRAAELGFSPRTLVVAGLTDGCASQFASGASLLGDWNSSLGTTLIVKGSTPELLRDPQGRLYCHRHPIKGWLPGAASNTGGECLTQQFAGADLVAMDRQAAAYLPSRLPAYPLRGVGERFPFVCPTATGFVEGASTSDAELYAAYLCGVACIERLGYEVIVGLGAPVGPVIYATGGASRSPLWLQVRATMLGRTLRVPVHPEAAMGVAALAAAGRLFPDFASAVQNLTSIAHEVVPDLRSSAAYEDLYQRFKMALQARGYG